MAVIKVQACWNSVFEGVPCLESDSQWGFFKDENDHRPSSCRWVDKVIDSSKQVVLSEF